MAASIGGVPVRERPTFVYDPLDRMLITDATKSTSDPDGIGLDPRIPETFRSARDFDRVARLLPPRPPFLAGGIIRRLSPLGRLIAYSPIYLFLGLLLCMQFALFVGRISNDSPFLVPPALVFPFCLLIAFPVWLLLKRRKLAEKLFRDGELVYGFAGDDLHWTSQTEDKPGSISGTVIFTFEDQKRSARLRTDWYMGPRPVGNIYPVLVHGEVPFVGVFTPTGNIIHGKLIRRGRDGRH